MQSTNDWMIFNLKYEIMSYSKGWKAYTRYIPHYPTGSLVDSMWFIGPNLGLHYSFWVGKELDCNFDNVMLWSASMFSYMKGFFIHILRVLPKSLSKKVYNRWPPLVCDGLWPCCKAIVTQEGDGCLSLVWGCTWPFLNTCYLLERQTCIDAHFASRPPLEATEYDMDEGAGAPLTAVTQQSAKWCCWYFCHNWLLFWPLLLTTHMYS